MTLRRRSFPTALQIAHSISARARAAAATEATTDALERRLSSRRLSLRLDREGPPPIPEEGEQDLEAEVRRLCPLFSLFQGCRLLARGLLPGCCALLHATCCL